MHVADIKPGDVLYGVPYKQYGTNFMDFYHDFAEEPAVYITVVSINRSINSNWAAVNAVEGQFILRNISYRTISNS